ncbi:MAG: phage terminase large subunit [Clostridia bacterium]|nr:phage terminase large subunit [Clostridia bacterium]
MSRTVLALGRPSEKQQLFLKARTKHVGFGGARGGGKSWAIRDKAKRLCLRYGGIKLLIVRRTYPELMNNHIMPLQSELPTVVAQFNKTEKLFRFCNGSTIRFGYCNRDRDLDQYQGAEYDVIFLDEATQLGETWIKKITACLRGANGFPKRIYYTCNPGGASHAYFKRLFIDRRYEAGENPDDYTFIQSLVTDNKALMEAQPDYIRQLEALPPKLRDAWLYGRWDIFDGQFFEEFRETPDLALCEKAGITSEQAFEQRRFTHVIRPFEIPRGWNIMRSYDFGYNKPFSLGYWAIDYDGILYRIAEVYGCTQTPDEGLKWTPDEQFRYFAEIERQHPLLKGRKITDSVADPAIWDGSRGESIAETANRYGIYFSPGDNERLAGWMQVHYRLQFDENGYPRMYFFDTCKAAIRTLPLMTYSQTKPEDLDTSREDHCPDEIRYTCMSRPIKPSAAKREARPLVSFDPLG